MKQAKRRRAEKRREGADARRHGRMIEILKALDLWAEFNRSVPAALRERILDLRAPLPVVSLASGLESEPWSEFIREGLERGLKRVTFRCPPLGDRFPVVDYFRLVKPLAACIVGVTASAGGRRPIAFLERGRAEAERIGSLEVGGLAVGALLRALGLALLPLDRIDRRVHSLAIQGAVSEGGRWFLRLVLDAHAPERVAAEIDGAVRPATRVPWSRPDGLSWVDWDPGIYGLQEGTGRLPVYVQGHALRAVAERLDRAVGGEWLMHQHMCHSLAEPIVARRDGPDVLVEFRINFARVGYLACRLVGRRVIVRTFLFLTMDGTPEGDALRRGLRLARDDKQFLGLDAMHTYLSTDLADDPLLTELFAGFGCGDLFELGRLAGPCSRRDAGGLGVAGLISKHLGLDAREGGVPIPAPALPSTP